MPFAACSSVRVAIIFCSLGYPTSQDLSRLNVLGFDLVYVRLFQAVQHVHPSRDDLVYAASQERIIRYMVAGQHFTGQDELFDEGPGCGKFLSPRLCVWVRRDGGNHALGCSEDLDDLRATVHNLSFDGGSLCRQESIEQRTYASENADRIDEHGCKFI